MVLSITRQTSKLPFDAVLLLLNFSCITVVFLYFSFSCCILRSLCVYSKCDLVLPVYGVINDDDDGDADYDKCVPLPIPQPPRLELPPSAQDSRRHDSDSLL